MSDASRSVNYPFRFPERYLRPRRPGRRADAMTGARHHAPGRVILESSGVSAVAEDIPKTRVFPRHPRFVYP